MKEDKRLIAIHKNENGQVDSISFVKNVGLREVNDLLNEQEQERVKKQNDYDAIKQEVISLKEIVEKLKREIKVLKGEE